MVWVLAGQNEVVPAGIVVVVESLIRERREDVELAIAVPQCRSVYATGGTSRQESKRGQLIWPAESVRDQLPIDQIATGVDR